MKQRFLPIAFVFPALGLFLFALRKFPNFAIAWGQRISRPVLQMLTKAGAFLPFSLMELGILALSAFLVLRFVLDRIHRNSAWPRLTLRTLKIVLSLALCFCTIWLPLYFNGDCQLYLANTAQILESCERLIAELNGSELDFSDLPEDLPAKFAAFPFWMRMLNISGFCSFFTGEALISPDLPNCGVPFVAMHEAMHLKGYAGEGEANIAAWRECMLQGGIYADSARLWALKDSLALLRRADYDAWAECQVKLQPRLRRLLQETGGGTAQPGKSVQAVFSALGVGDSIRNYEMLALYLAANMPE